MQVKVKAKEGKGVTSVTLATAIHPRDPVGKRWWLRGCISRKLAEDIIQLIKDMSSVCHLVYRNVCHFLKGGSYCYIISFGHLDLDSILLILSTL